MVTNSVMMQVFGSFAKTQGEHVETLSRDRNFNGGKNFLALSLSKNEFTVRQLTFFLVGQRENVAAL
jgi:hypothetical protein